MGEGFSGIIFEQDAATVTVTFLWYNSDNKIFIASSLFHGSAPQTGGESRLKT